MSPKSDPETAATWRRTKHLRETLALARFLDGSRTVPEAAELAGVPTVSAWRVLASLRHLATNEPDLVRLQEKRDARKAYHRVELLPAK